MCRESAPFARLVSSAALVPTNLRATRIVWASAKFNCGIFGTAWAKFRRPVSYRERRSQKPGDFEPFLRARLARLLPLRMVSLNVFRAAVLSIVLTLAVGPNASLLCAVWCHPDAAAGPCEHPDATSRSSATSEHSCPAIGGGSTAFVREDVRRGVSTPQTKYPVVVPPLLFTPPPPHALSIHAGAQSPPLQTRRVVLTLRI